MPDSTKSPKEIRFTYNDAGDYRLIYSTGAQGGIMPSGMIKFDLYAEFQMAPHGEKRQLLDDGKLGKSLFEGLQPGIIDVIRRRQVGVIMSAQDARSLAQWLDRKADESEKLHSKSAKPKESK